MSGAVELFKMFAALMLLGPCVVIFIYTVARVVFTAYFFTRNKFNKENTSA